MHPLDLSKRSRRQATPTTLSQAPSTVTLGLYSITIAIPVTLPPYKNTCQVSVVLPLGPPSAHGKVKLRSAAIEGPVAAGTVRTGPFLSSGRGGGANLPRRADGSVDGRRLGGAMAIEPDPVSPMFILAHFKAAASVGVIALRIAEN